MEVPVRWKIKKRMEWIDCDIKRPKIGEDVLIYCGYVTVANYYGIFQDSEGNSFQYVTHWMPLPDGPEGENEKIYNNLPIFDPTEAVGCGKEFAGHYGIQNCGVRDLCPYCQAKANQPEKPESSKVTLPEVPDWRAFEKAAESAVELYKQGGPLARLDPPTDQNGRDKESTLTQKVVLPEVPSYPYESDKWHEQAVEFMLAVKAHLEGKDDS